MTVGIGRRQLISAYGAAATPVVACLRADEVIA